MRKKWIALAPLMVVGLVLFVTLGGVIVRELWNWLLPQLFGFPRITFWQALGLLLLCRILFGGFSGRSRYRARSRMTPEERERFRRRVRERFGSGPSPQEGEGP
jgi:hypothetical protein